jgi:hypothetical protein
MGLGLRAQTLYRLVFWSSVLQPKALGPESAAKPWEYRAKAGEFSSIINNLRNVRPQPLVFDRTIESTTYKTCAVVSNGINNLQNERS